MSSFYSLLINSDFGVFSSALKCADFDIRHTSDNGFALAQKIANLSILEKSEIAQNIKRMVVSSNYEPIISDAACLCLFASQDFTDVIAIVEKSIEKHGYIRSEYMARNLIWALMCQARWEDLELFAGMHQGEIDRFNLTAWITLARKIQRGDVATVCNSLTNGVSLNFLLSAFNSSILATSLDHSEGKLLESKELGILAKYINRGNVLDIGCLCGNHSLYFSKVCGAEKVVSVDSDSGCCALTALNFRLNRVGSENFSVINAFAGGDIPFSAIREYSHLGNSFHLDGECEKYDLVKVDIDGGEVELLRRSRDYFRKTKAALMCEVTTKSAATVFNIMSSIGYDCIPLTNRSSHDGDNNYLFTSV